MSRHDGQAADELSQENKALREALKTACDEAEFWIPNMGIEPARWKAARARIAELRKLLK